MGAKKGPELEKDSLNYINRTTTADNSNKHANPHLTEQDPEYLKSISTPPNLLRDRCDD